MRNYSIIFAWLLLIACSSPNRPGEKGHAARVQQILRAADTLTRDPVTRVPHFIDSAFQSIPDAGQLEKATKYDYLAAYYLHYSKNYEKAWIYADSVLHILTDSIHQPDYIKVYARAILMQGDILELNRKFNDAILYYYRGRQFILKTNDSCIFNEYSKRLAMLYYAQGRYQEAITYYKEAFDALFRCPENLWARFTERQGQLNNIALCYINLRQPYSALYYCDSALRYINQYRQQHADDSLSLSQRVFIRLAQAVVNGTKGEALRQKGDVDTAEQLFREAILLTDQKGYDPEFAQSTMNRLLALLLEQRRYDEAKSLLWQLRQSLDKLLPNIRAEMLWQEKRWMYYDALGKTDSAYTALKNYLQLKDSIIRASNPLRVIDIQNQFNTISQRYELSLLRKQDELKTVYLIIALVVFVMALVIILLVLRNNRKSKKYITELGKLNRFITAQNHHMEETLSALEQSQQENTRMMKIVAHDLRNPVGNMVTLTKYLEEHKNLTKESGEAPLKLIKESGDRALKLIDEMLRPNESQK